LQEDDYFELHENMTERGVGLVNLKNIFFLSKWSIENTKLEDRYGATKT